MLLRIPSIFLNFRNIEIAFIFLIAMKLCFNGLALMENMGKDTTPSLSPYTPKVFAESKAAEPETTPYPVGEKTSPVNIEMLETIKKRSEELDARSTALDQKEEQLNMLQTTIDQKLQKMTSVQKKIEELLAAREDLIGRSIKHLVKVYSAMKPNEAAKLMEKLDQDISIQIFSKMKGKNAAKILGKMDTSIATNLSDKIAKRK